MAKQFEREERYLVVKLSELADDQGDGMSRREQIYRLAHFGKALVECVVIESDWPEYEPTWAAIEARVNGKVGTLPDERAAFEAWAKKHHIQGGKLHYIRDALPKDDPRYREYVSEALRCSWWGWEARAALIPTPEKEVPARRHWDACPACHGVGYCEECTPQPAKAGE